MAAPPLEYLGRAERRERHSVRPHRGGLRAQAESGVRVLADPRGRTPCGRGAQGPEGTAPAVLGSGLVVPPAVVAEAVTERSIGRLRLGEEVQVAAPEGDDLLGWRRLTADHHEAAGNVVHAVAVLVPGHDPLGVFEQPNVIGQPLQVPERCGRATHAVAPTGAVVSVEVSSR
jgi:hypothetical protein